MLHNRRKSDAPTDDLLLDLLKRMKERDPGFMPKKELEELTRQRRLFMARKARHQPE